MPVNGLFTQIEEYNKKKVYYKTIPEELIPSEDVVNNFIALEEVVMIGYPIGLCDKINKLPVFRHGYTASHPAYLHDGRRSGLIDIAVFPGSSGSPVLIYNYGVYVEHDELKSGSRAILLGIAFSGYALDSGGSIQSTEKLREEDGQSGDKMMINIAEYIKSEVLMDLKEELFKLAGLALP